MKEITYLIIGLVVGYLIGKHSRRILRSAQDDKGVGSKSLNQEQTEKKNIHLMEILSEVNTHGEITNDEVERKLGVSNATAERYLDELEKQEKIVQIGRTGRSVKYARK